MRVYDAELSLVFMCARKSEMCVSEKGWKKVDCEEKRVAINFLYGGCVGLKADVFLFFS
jgi:hypothetical protein